ncbi:MAG: isochorismatase family cysteine hydrolase [Candidatus Binatus sp.]|uniref:cysteine hydrolase family protein n=1 Tax=Candidatus Binatus sp. TaxID=2811406 RepID=UPI00272159C7|nr:isochorismatase family cysteine hydrolase [Candidatus Binatus sp.]MDO8432801.1 isochorismatase family cysteine hydrolase [Candidatus Binatus sp.]
MDAKLTRDATALIVVDMQNGYLHPKGSFARLYGNAASPQFDLTLLRRAIPGCAKLIAAARRANVPVIYLKYVYRPDYKDGGVLIQEINPALKTVQYVADGTWDAEIVDELAPEPGDFIVKKSRYSGFHATRLETVLRSLQARSLVICGVTTHFCVECTARDAHMRDYRVFIARDATDEANPAWKEMALASFQVGFGWVFDVDEIAQSWSVADVR